jgi:hypothetical protein
MKAALVSLVLTGGFSFCAGVDRKSLTHDWRLSFVEGRPLLIVCSENQAMKYLPNFVSGNAISLPVFAGTISGVTFLSFCIPSKS